MEGELRRFSSCRGVSFEINLNERAFTIPRQVDSSDRFSSLRAGLRWSLVGSLESWPSSVYDPRCESYSSSHFCDVLHEDEEDGICPVSYVDPEKHLTGEVVGEPNGAKLAKSSESRLSVILLDQGLLTVYKRLFALTIFLNMVLLALTINGSFAYGRQKSATFAIYNVLVLTLCRSEILLRVVFWCSVKALGRTWMPLWVKTATTSFLQSVGGIHSGCGLSSVAWLVYALVRSLQKRDSTSPEIIGVASAILSLLFFSCMAAFPLVRHLHHNFFERTHRFAGWSALALLWVFVALDVGYDPDSKSYGKLTASRLVRQQEFWLTLMITVFIFMPWVTIRRVPVTVSSSSGHASIIKFAGGVKAGLLGRISRSPLSEWHAFGIISRNKESHMMLAGAVGDFTRGLVTDPPSHLWVRGVHFAGLPYLVNMYRRVVLVATGSGIAVFLSFLLQPCDAEVCLLWVTKAVDLNFGPEIKGMLNGHQAGKVIIHDTAVSGRPNVAKLTVETAKMWNAEAVIVTSNPQGSRDVVAACMAEQIPAFGPIWDS